MKSWASIHANSSYPNGDHITFFNELKYSRVFEKNHAISLEWKHKQQADVNFKYYITMKRKIFFNEKND
jgi:hypothetical protein